MLRPLAACSSHWKSATESFQRLSWLGLAVAFLVSAALPSTFRVATRVNERYAMLRESCPTLSWCR